MEVMRVPIMAIGDHITAVTTGAVTMASTIFTVTALAGIFTVVGVDITAVAGDIMVVAAVTEVMADRSSPAKMVFQVLRVSG